MIEDDFDRFCRIGKGYHSPNPHAQRLQSGPEIYDQQEQQSSVRQDFLTAPQSISRYRSSSLREHHRRSPYQYSPRASLTRRQESSFKERISPEGPLSLSTDLPGRSRRHSLAPTFQNPERQPLQASPYSRGSIHQFERALQTTSEERATENQHVSDRTQLDRSASARCTADVDKSTTWLSNAPGGHASRRLSNTFGLTVPSVPPIQVFSEESPEACMNVVRVRSFRRTKNGVVSQGDSDIFYRPANNACTCRHSLSCGSELMAAEATASGSGETTNVPEQRSSDEQSPTAVVRRKPRHGSAHERPRKKFSHQEIYALDKVEAARVIRRKSLTPTWVCSDHSDTESAVKMSPQTYTVQVLGHDEDIVHNVTVDVDNEQTTLRFIENADGENASVSM
ncbi:unnamed protein product [Dibothriocephalus latus]|uniref:Uncharacterized protein n=1 Tax=Dibothriocephalus latus TaxID=60516 RepID=A0A3P6TG53_DIBLA|nr:unnamed protein product [Dibothriocephalus latus]